MMIVSDLVPLGEGTSRLDRNQVQLTLAVADGEMLRSLLVDSTPAIAQLHQVGQIRISIGPPAKAKGLESVDAVLEYEHLWCLLSEGAPSTSPASVRDYQYLTRCQSELKTLAWRVNLSEVIALLSHAGFSEEQIQRILLLPWDGWHRSWWDTFDSQGQLGLPFQRWFRTRCYGDGTYTLQYRDHYPQDAPRCFRGVWQQVPIMIAHSRHQFGDLLTNLRKAQHALKAERCLLLADALTELEAEGYMRQGVSLYPLKQAPIPAPTLCRHCDRHQCPMSDHPNSPVMNCRDYIPSPH